MKRAVVLALLFAACSSSQNSGTNPVGGHGAISVQIIPNPIVAKAVAGDKYDFPFEVVVRETGGRPVTINRVTADVYALGSIPVGSEAYDAAQIRALGYQTTVPANGELRYRFSPRKTVPNESLFGSVSAQVKVHAQDDTGAATSGAVNVTVTK